MQKNEIVVNFLGGLRGFLREGKSVIHLETNHVISPYYDTSSAFSTSSDKSTELSGTEDLRININGNDVVYDYRVLIDFYIASHAKIAATIEGGNSHQIFLEMRKHLEIKFSQNGFCVEEI